ncbi:gliding motility-associated protein GldE [Brumimicrobium aurantiacum]|uniref:Gliding motility-associated protein GldE n=1 Tax=Brumimicrobium aurantiacum TaxID=1737063 RepID=A0A3E1F0P5_9FLAO|nr:gliding motility-associated protein GldE [Brumimicrobium aurantiacum]RFC55375.1 gliding motility-associated protein GldE [Brumimicrobium aurantiacum]
MDDIEPLSSFFLSIPSADFGISFWISIAVLLLLLIASALVSGSEVAFFSLSPEDKESVRESAAPSSDTTLNLLNNPKDLLATILITNNFVNVAIVILSSFIFNQIYPVNPDVTGVDYLRAAVEIGGITFVLLLIGEVIPKVYANRNSLTLVKLMSSPLSVIGKIPPFSWLRIFLVNGTDVILKYARKRQIDVSTDDLENAIALTREENTTADEQRILEGIVNFGNTDVRQIMCSRVDTVALNEELSYEELMEVILNSGYSRIPVFKETFDNVTGILFVKDLLAHLNAPADFAWNEIIRQPFFVPENKKIDDLLKEFQEKKMHMAVVVDEYGGSSGVVTLEDVLEEIIGEITDEFDDEDIIYTKVDESTYVFEGKTSLVDMYKVLSIDGKAFEEVKGESDSIGGFLIEQSGRILKNNEAYTFENFKFVVETSDKKRVKTVKIIIL